jgi:hypothetical protein
VRLVKMLGLAAVAALASMAFIAGTASAAHLVVLCDEDPTGLCPEGHLLPKDTIIHGKLEPYGGNNHAILLSEGAAGNELCETSAVLGKITKSSPLHGAIETVSFTGNCKPCSTVTISNTPYLAIFHHDLVGEHLWLFLVTGTVLALFTGCPFGAECGFSTEKVHLDVKNTATGLPLILSLKNVLKLHKGSAFLCGSEGQWDANYVTECLDALGKHKKCWLALDEKEAA